MPFQSLITFLATNLLWQTTLIGLCVFIALHFLPHTQAKTRYQISLCGLFSCFLLCIVPFLPSFIQNTSFGVASETINQPLSYQTYKNITPEDNSLNIFSPQISIANSLETAINLRAFVPMGLTVLWIIGTGLMCIRIFMAACQTHVLVESAMTVKLPQDHNLSRNVIIRKSPDITSPLVFGFFKPIILVPVNFDLNIKTPETRAILEHEIAHIDRKDIWTNLAQRFVLALLWWCLPLYWINTQIIIEREKLCDDIAAQKTGKGKALARALVDLAETQIRTSPSQLALGFHPRASHLAERVQRLYKGPPMTKISKRLFLTTSLVVPLTLISLAVVTPRAFAHNQKPKTVSEVLKPIQSKKPTSFEYALYHAAKKNDLTSAKQLLLDGTNPNIALVGDGSPLITAVRSNNTEMVRMLLEFGATANFPSRGDGNPLIAAAKRANMKLAQLLIANNADVNFVTIGDETPLMNAVRSGSMKMVKYLVTQGADVTLGTWEHHRNGAMEWRTPLGEATKHGKTRIAKYLKSIGATEEDGTPKRVTYHPAPSHDIVKGRITSRFGHVRKLDNKAHQGIDIANIVGTPIYAPANGVIITATDAYPKRLKLGKTVVLETADGTQTLFAHLNDFTVVSGNKVKAGDLIGHIGNTGVSTGPHVHIETRAQGKLMDPQTIWNTLK